MVGRRSQWQKYGQGTSISSRGKGFVLGKGNNFYQGETVYFATKHGKEKIAAPLFESLKMNCKRIEVNTDLFGTFSGEVERVGSIRETLRRKIAAASAALPEARLCLASEGSFGPDPFTGFAQIGVESVLFRDHEFDLEIYAEHICRNPVHAEGVFGLRDDWRAFLKKIDFPNHAVMVRPAEDYYPLFKGLKTEADVGQAMIDCFMASEEIKVSISTDLRAHNNKTRRAAIAKAIEALIEKIESTCPHCDLPGYGISRGIPGLECEACGEPSLAIGSVEYECAKCGFTTAKLRPDGIRKLPQDECERCNP